MANFLSEQTSAAVSASTMDRGFHFLVRKAMMLERGEELSAQIRMRGLCATDWTRRKSALQPGVSSITIFSGNGGNLDWGSPTPPAEPGPPVGVCWSFFNAGQRGVLIRWLFPLILTDVTPNWTCATKSFN